MRSVGHLIFPDASEHLMNAAIEATWNTTASRLGNVILEQAAAVHSAENQLTDITQSRCLFVQLFDKLQPLPPFLLRSKLDEKERLFRVYFKGVDGQYERGVDWGGLYRDTMTRVTVCGTPLAFVALDPPHPLSLVDLFWLVCSWRVFAVAPLSSVVRGVLFNEPTQEDLFSDNFNLFTRVPNFAQHDANADTFVPNPKHTSARAMEMFEFVGKLMGISVRHKVQPEHTTTAPGPM